MSTAATETIIENHVNGSKTAVKAFSDKNTSGKNGFIKEKSTEEYFLDIVKEAISKKLSDDEEAKEDSKNIVVDKVVEIEEQILNSDLVNESNNFIETKVSSVKIETNPRICENNVSSNHSTETVKDNLVNSSNQNNSVNMDLKLEVSSDVFIEENDLKVHVKSETEFSDFNRVSSVTDNVSNFSATDSNIGTVKSEITDPVSSLEEKETSATVSKLLNNYSEIISKENNANDKCEVIVANVEQEINSNIKENNENFEKQCINEIEEDIQINQTSKTNNVHSVEETNTEVNKKISELNKDASVDKSSEIVNNLEKTNEITDKNKDASIFPKVNESSEIIKNLDKNKEVLNEKNKDVLIKCSEINLEKTNEITDENKDTIIFPKTNESTELVENVEISNEISNKNKDSLIVPPVEQSSEIVEKSNTSLNSENNCVSIQLDVENDSLKKTSFNIELNSENNSSEEGNPIEVQNEIIVDNSLNISQNEKSVEVISSNIDENTDKTVKHSLKRPPTPNLIDKEISKKIKLCNTEEDKSKSKANKRLGTECNNINETKKNRPSNIQDLEQPITSKESTENSDVRENKENNKYFQTDEKNDEKLDKKDRIRDLKKLNKEKLKKKELKKIKDKKEKDIIQDVNGKNESAGSDIELQGKSKETEETCENENIQPPGIGKLKLKKKRKGPDEDDEYELLNNPVPTSCPLCSCDCKIKKADRKILGEKTRGLMDILSDSSDNININLVKLEELVGQTVVDWATNKCEIGVVRKRAHFLEEEHDRLIQLTVNLKKQLDDARCIMKRMIDEKLAQKSWSEGIVPLKVTRSVGMQVCTVGSAHVLIKRQEEKDKESSRLYSPKSSSFTTNVTNPELQSKNNSSESNKQGIEISSNSVSGISNAITAKSHAVNPLSETNTEVTRMDTSSNVGNNRVIISGRTTPRQADSAQNIMNVNIIDDDIEVIEPVVSKVIPVQPLSTATTTTAATNNNNNNNNNSNSNNQILINATLTTFSTATNTTSSTSATSASKTIAPAIYILKTADVPTVQNVSSQVQIPLAATPTQQAATPPSEVIDLTDSEPVSYQSNSSNTTNGTTRSPMVRLQAGQTVTTNTVNLAVATNGSQNKVVTFPADSTTFVIHRTPNSPNTGVRKTSIQSTSSTDLLLTAMSSLPPLPRSPKYGANVLKPPKPVLRICKNSTGIMLSWNFDEPIQTIIRKYQVFAYQEGTPIDNSNRSDMWKKVGDVDALPLPMACTLTQFKEGHRYYFVVRAVDTNSKLGEFSLPGSIMLTSSSPNAVNRTTGTRV